MPDPGVATDVALGAESDAVAVVTSLLAGDMPSLRSVVAAAAPDRRLLTGFLLAERAVAAAAGRSRESGLGDGGRSLFIAALHSRDDLGAASSLTMLGSGGQVAVARAASAQLIVAFARRADLRMRAILQRHLGPATTVASATVFCACLGELTAAVLTTVSEQRGEGAHDYLQRWGLELATDAAARAHPEAGGR